MDGVTTSTEPFLLTAPKHYLWWFPGSPITVHLDLRVVERLQEQLRETSQGVAQQGLLFGRCLGSTTEILDFQLTSDGDLPDVVAGMPNERSDRLLVGCYRTEPGETLRLNDKDLSLLEALFPKPYQVFLLIQSNGFGPPNATFFFRDSGSRIPNVALLEFPVDAALLAVEEQQRMKRSRQPALEQADTPQPLAATASEAHPRRSNRVLRAAVWLLFATCILGAGVLVGTRSFREKFSHAWSVIRTQQLAPPPPRTPSPPSMDLHARRQNGDLELTWNRESALVATATSGVLSIKDGDLKLQIPLDSTQVRHGSVLYAPSTDQIRIQFTVTTAEHAVTESVMVLLPRAGVPRTQPWEAPKVSAGPSPRPQPPSDGISQPKTPKPFTDPSTPQRPLLTPAVALGAPPMPTANPNPGPAVFPLVVSQTPPPPPPMPGSGPQAMAQQPASVAAAPLQHTASNIRPEFQPPVAIAEARPRFPLELKPVVSKPVIVEVRVSIDRKGKVVNAESVTPNPTHKLFVNEAVHAARLWRFQPARLGNKPVESDVVLKFVFNKQLVFEQ